MNDGDNSDVFWLDQINNAVALKNQFPNIGSFFGFRHPSAYFGKRLQFCCSIKNTLNKLSGIKAGVFGDISLNRF